MVREMGLGGGGGGGGVYSRSPLHTYIKNLSGLTLTPRVKENVQILI